MPTKDNDWKLHPSVDTAFDFVVPSYQWALERFERNDSRLQQVVTVAASITVGIPILVDRISDVSIAVVGASTVPLVLAEVVGIGIVIFGLLSKQKHTLKLPGLTNIHREHLSLPVYQFKRNYIFWAGEDQCDNLEAIEWKASRVTQLSYWLIVQIVLFLAWIATGWYEGGSTDAASLSVAFI